MVREPPSSHLIHPHLPLKRQLSQYISLLCQVKGADPTQEQVQFEEPWAAGIKVEGEASDIERESDLTATHISLQPSAPLLLMGAPCYPPNTFFSIGHIGTGLQMLGRMKEEPIKKKERRL